MAVQVSDDEDFYEVLVNSPEGLLAVSVVENETKLGITVGKDGKKSTVILDLAETAEFFAQVGKLSVRIVRNMHRTRTYLK